MLRLASSLRGYGIEATDGAIGSVSDLLFDDTTWKLRWLVVDTGGWLGGARVLIHPSMIGIADGVDMTLSLRLSQSQVKDSPGRLQDRPVSQQVEDDLYNYYGWDPLWAGSYFGSGTTHAMRVGMIAQQRNSNSGAPKPGENGDPHLRSTAEVTGYHVHATDGDIGHVQDMLVDDGKWVIEYLIVDTSNWWIGKHVLISPFAVREIDYPSSHVHLNINRDKIRSSPPWQKDDPTDLPYQQKLHGYYDWPGYGW